MTIEQQRCGHVALIGRPNVGKSTLLNALLQQKISITSRKPQTTRQQILGIRTDTHVQMAFVDTPGIHQQNTTALNQSMNRAAKSAFNQVDVILMLAVAGKWTAADQAIVDMLQTVSCPVILILNKIDQFENKNNILPVIASHADNTLFDRVIPVSALAADNVEHLFQTLQHYCPKQPFQYDLDYLTDKSERFMVAEIIREKIIRLTGDEIPYSVAIEIEQWQRKKKVLHISTIIYVAKANHKRMIIGAKGDRLKKVGQSARYDIERLIESKVFLQLWVKVKSGWSDDQRALLTLGYHD